MQTQQHVSLKPYNTFSIDVTAASFIEITSETLLREALSTIKQPLFILGGGSNMLLTQNIDATVLHINIKGITTIKETATHVRIKAMAGENWHDFVCHCIENNYGGLENLSLIPGNVGTSPIQNIGAYGVELKDCFVSCDAIEIATQEKKTFTQEDCEFGYRNSIFKNELKGKYIITSVTFQLTKSEHVLHTGYGAINDNLAKNNISNPTIQDVAKAVISIRQSKLPDPAKIGNSGSFFKNPVVDAVAFTTFNKAFPEAPFYKVSSTEYKIPAGWLIEQAGFKGKRYGDAGVHTKQALVLVNYDNASGQDIWELAMRIQKKVNTDFGILIEPEVNIV